MEEKNKKIREWYGLWLAPNSNAALEDIFAEDAIYIDAWGKVYRGLPEIRNWFRAWEKCRQASQMDILSVLDRSDGDTVVEWHFVNAGDGTTPRQEMEGVSTVKWNPSGRIIKVQEFGRATEERDPCGDWDTEAPVLAEQDNPSA